MKIAPRVPFLFALLLLVCATSGPGTAADPAPTLAEVLKDYESLGLPLPPKTAKFVRYRGFAREEDEPVGYGLAFELKPGTKTENPVLLDGINEWHTEFDPRAQEVKPNRDALKGTNFSADKALVLAVQCQSRGWTDLAQALYEQSQKQSEKNSRELLTEQATKYWWGHVTHPTIDRAIVVKRLKELMKRDPELDDEGSRELLRSLELALVPSTAKPGSAEALIDALVDYHAKTGKASFSQPAPAYWRIAERGFDAVPALIEHLGDDRLTRAAMVGFNNFGTWTLRVGDVVGDLLEGLAAEELARGTDKEDVGGGWLRRQQGWRVRKAAATGWWAKAQKQGEEAYLLDRVLPPAPEGDRRTGANEHLLRVIAVKYPKQVPVLYRKVLDQRPELDSSALVETLARSSAPVKDKLDLLASGAEHKDYAHRLPALRAIKKLDQKRFDALLLAAIENFPKDVPGKYARCNAGPIAALAIESTDPRVWAVLEKVAKRSALGVRMELLSEFGDPQELRHRGERLQLLAAFLDDSELRDVKADERFVIPSGGYLHDRIEVRNSVALDLADLLEIKIKPKDDRAPAEWAEIRTKVRESLKRELDKMK